MDVFALIGRSGTGKSYKAILLTKELDIEYMIDDGLFIKGNKIIAGKSAKREGTKVAAVKTAIFSDPSHRLSVREAIKEKRPESILLIGTSEKMIKKIMKSLDLGDTSKNISIEDVASKQDIELARYQRTVEGKHIIPVPTFEVKKDFSGYFMDSLKIFKKKDNVKKESYEKTVMRPTFSYLGRYKISDDAIRDIIKANLLKREEIHKAPRIYVESFTEGIIINIEVDIYFGYHLERSMSDIQKQIVKEIEYMTSLNVLLINIHVKALRLRKQATLT